MLRNRRRVATAAALACVAVGLAGCGKAAATPGATLSAFVADWSHRDWSAMARLVDAPPADFVARNKQAYADLDATGVSVRAAAPAGHGPDRQARIAEHVAVAGLGRNLVIASTVRLRHVGARWLVIWGPGTIDPRLAAGDHFALRFTWGTRAAVTGAGGAPLISAVPEVEVGLVGQRLKDPAEVDSLLEAAGATPAQVTPALAAAKAHPTYFEPVFDVSTTDFTTNIRPSELYAIPGTQFEKTTVEQAVTPDLGEYVVGGIGPVTAQQLGELGTSYAAGDLVGQGGLEAEYQKRLAGSPGETVTIQTARDTVVSTLARTAPKAGAPVATSISPSVQEAADSAIAATTQPAALVAVKASTGQVLAIANHIPSGSTSLDYALDATEAPGSAFKIVTSSALIDKGLTPASTATCPSTRTVDGETFHNDEGEAFGTITLLSAFAQSCNTAFIGLATSDLTSDELLRAAAGYDLGDAVRMGYPAYGGTVPRPTDDADFASTSIGQGQITVAPIDLAMMAAAVDSGTVRRPRLVVGAPDDTAPTKTVDPTVDRDLHTMMAQVVASGTAAGQGLPSGTYGKTGTAEFGNAHPPQTHAWFVGFDGDIAFAVYVDVGSSGGAVAAPLAAKFLDAVGSSVP